MTLDIHGLMQELSKSRPIFHSEADFQLALFRLINKKRSDCRIRMEEPFLVGEKSKRRVDIWLPRDGVAIELKYFTKCLRVCHNSEPFALKEQAASDLARRLFVNDARWLEQLLQKGENGVKEGYAIFLTNDPLLWKCSGKGSTSNYRHFRIHEGNVLSGHLAWLKGKVENPPYSISLCGSYTMYWCDYSKLGNTNNQQFRYLAVAVQKVSDQ